MEVPDESDGSVTFAEFAPYLRACCARCPELQDSVDWVKLADDGGRLSYQQAEILGDTCLTLRSDQKESMERFIRILEEAGLTRKR